MPASRLSRRSRHDARSRRWLDLPPVIQHFAGGGRGGTARIAVVRDDLIDGGTKLRFLPFLCGNAKEVVYGCPFCDGAAYALSVWARTAGRRATLFYAARERRHWRQHAAEANGARLVMVEPGYMTVVQKRARDNAVQAGALILPLGFDMPAAVAPLVEAARAVGRAVSPPDQVWCATGSGMLARALGFAFPDAEICAVTVGLASRHLAQQFSRNVRLIDAVMPFERPIAAGAPFPSCGNYDRKAWAVCVHEARGSVLFWNVAGDGPADARLIAGAPAGAARLPACRRPPPRSSGRSPGQRPAGSAAPGWRRERAADHERAGHRWPARQARSSFVACCAPARSSVRPRSFRAPGSVRRWPGRRR